MIAVSGPVAPHPPWYGPPGFLTKINDFNRYSLLRISFRLNLFWRSSGEMTPHSSRWFPHGSPARESVLVENFVKHGAISQTTHILVHQMTPTMIPTMDSTMCLDLGLQCQSTLLPIVF